MTSSSSTMLFDANGNGIFGEPDDNIKQLVGGTFTIMARDTEQGTGIEITATDVLGRFGYNTYATLNTAPVAFLDGYNTNEDTQLVVPVPGVLGNDIDVDVDPLTAILVAGPSHGSLALNADGSFTYAPDLNYNGPDSFTYKANDEIADSNVATVTLAVTAVNDVPVAVADAYSTDEDAPLLVPAPGVLGNDSDVDSAVLSAVKITDPAHGSLVLNADGSFTYRPSLNFNGSDSFTYKANDGSADSNTVTVTIRVTPINDAPVADAQSVPTDEDIAVAITLTASDVDSSSLTYAIVTPPGHGTLSGTPPIVTYTPASNYHGSDSFTFKANDGSVDSAPATVTIKITPVNDAPTITVSTATQTVQYSDGIDEVTVSVEDIDSFGSSIQVTKSWKVNDGVWQNNLPADLSLSNEPCADNGAGTTCQWKLSGIADVPAGAYVNKITVSDGPLASDVQIEIKVDPEDASVAFDDNNDVGVQVATPGGASGEFDLTVYVRETQPDLPEGLGAYGDINLAQVSMVLQPVGPGSPVSGNCESVPGGTGTGYDSFLTTTCDFDNVPVNTYTVQVTVNGGYYTGYAEDVLVVYDPSLGFATGGGWFYWPIDPEEEPPYEGYPGDRTNFGFTMKYNKKGTTVQGSLLLIRHLFDGSIYRVKSNALYGLALGKSPDGNGGTFGWASFSGKATYLEPGWSEPIGNHEFIVYLEDRDEPGHGVDRFWMEVKDQNREVIDEMSMGRDGEGYVLSIEIEGGNIVVPHR